MLFFPAILPIMSNVIGKIPGRTKSLIRAKGRTKTRAIKCGKERKQEERSERNGRVGKRREGAGDGRSTGGYHGQRRVLLLVKSFFLQLTCSPPNHKFECYLQFPVSAHQQLF